MQNNRLSSDYLYSYTPKFDTLKDILKFGFRFSRNVETLPGGKYQQENYIVCFCDILTEQSDYHKEMYGKNALAMKKSWGIKNGVSPLRYVHTNSPGCSTQYNSIKNDIRKTLSGQNPITDLLSIIVFSDARRRGILTKEKFEDETDNSELQSFLDGINQRFQEKKEKFGSKGLKEIFNDWIEPLFNQLNHLVNELELRDSYMRIYQGDFRDTQNKILYDEREWRAVKNLMQKDIDSNSNLEEICKVQGYLPEKDNLKFTPDDLFEVLVESNERKIELSEFIKNELPDYLNIIPSIRATVQ